MPCCCKSYVQAAFVLGVIFFVLNILVCFLGISGDLKSIVSGVLGALNSGILIFGAYKWNSTAILVWMILVAIECFVDFILFGIEIFDIASAPTIDVEEGIVFGIMAIFLYAGVIIFTIGAIFVAKYAREEIANTDKDERAV